MSVQMPQGEGAILGIVQSIDKHCESLLRYMQQKINNSISATAAADCIALNGSMSH